MRATFRTSTELQTSFIRGWDYVLKYFPRQIRDYDTCQDLLSIIRGCYFRIVELNFAELSYAEGDLDEVTFSDYIDIVEEYLDDVNIGENDAEMLINELYNNPLFVEYFQGVLDDIMTDKYHNDYLPLLVSLILEVLPPIGQVDFIVQETYKYVMSKRIFRKWGFVITSLKIMDKDLLVKYSYARGAHPYLYTID